MSEVQKGHKKLSYRKAKQLLLEKLGIYLSFTVFQNKVQWDIEKINTAHLSFIQLFCPSLGDLSLGKSKQITSDELCEIFSLIQPESIVYEKLEIYLTGDKQPVLNFKI